MRKIFAIVLLLAAVAVTGTAAFAHGDKSHQLLGTVKSLHENHLTITTPDGKEATVELTAETQYEKGGKPSDRSALVEGARVSISLAEDDKTAVKVKIGSGG